MKVIAPTGIKCPMEGNARKYITDRDAVEVPATSYYKRLIADGSLLIAPRKQKEVKTDGV
jgi:hypothetical protein